MIRTLELFSGYGGAEFSFNKTKIPHKTVGFSDIIPAAIKCYQQNHHGVSLGDITKINPETLQDFDLLTGGFPCQSFSIAGKREGFESEKTGNLFFEIIRIARAKLPTYMLLENVKGILSHDDGETHRRVLSELRALGYGVAWKCLNSKHYGIPQNRERVWYVCKLGGWDFMEFQFPEKVPLTLTIKDILEDQVDEKYYLSEKQLNNINMYNKNNQAKNRGFKSVEQNEICKTITSHAGKDTTSIPFIADFRYDEGLRIRKNGHSPCLNTSDTPILEMDNKLRRLTPKECFRLMGFLNDEINLDGLSDNAKYQLAGNGWEINVASKILHNMFKTHMG